MLEGGKGKGGVLQKGLIRLCVITLPLKAGRGRVAGAPWLSAQVMDMQPTSETLSVRQFPVGARRPWRLRQQRLVCVCVLGGGIELPYGQIGVETILKQFSELQYFQRKLI